MLIELLEIRQKSFDGLSLSVVDIGKLSSNYNFCSAMYSMLLSTQWEGYEQLHISRNESLIYAQKGDERMTFCPPPSIDEFYDSTKNFVGKGKWISGQTDLRIFYDGGYANWVVRSENSTLSFYLGDVVGNQRFLNANEQVVQCLAILSRYFIPLGSNPSEISNELMRALELEIKNASGDNYRSFWSDQDAVFDNELVNVIEELVKEGKVRIHTDVYNCILHRRK